MAGSPSRATVVVVKAVQLSEIEALLGAGRVDHRSVRLWARLGVPVPHEIDLTGAMGPAARFRVEPASAFSDGTGAWTYPDDVGGSDLAPLSSYRARLLRGGAVIAEASFQTGPRSQADAPERWSFAVLSCNQPYDKHGAIHSGGLAMFRAALQAVEQSDARFALMMGDQVYADRPSSLSLFDSDYFSRVAPDGQSSILECSRDQVRALYQQRHRQFWSPVGFRELQARLACYPILDDHEVVDNFGTHPDHALPGWAATRQGALDAYFDYQASRVAVPTADGRRPRTFDYGFRWGAASFYALDIRSDRRTRDGITECYTPAQFEALREFLAAQADQSLLVLITTIPLIYLEAKIARAAAAVLGAGSDLHERWSHPQCVEHRDRLLGLLVQHAKRHPHQTMLLLGGDVHAAAAYDLALQGGTHIYQFVSSAISNRESLLMRKATEFATQLVSKVELEPGCVIDVSALPDARGCAGANPYGGLNMGIVDVATAGEVCSVTLRIISYDDANSDGGYVTVFESEPLSR